jgi:SAM-dependent methyltransferase
MSNIAWNADDYNKNARFVSDYGHQVANLLGEIRGLRVLDLGCGDGPLTKELENRGADVVGVDASPAMIEKAKELGLNVAVMDARELTFDNEFDAVFSNATLHCVKPPELAVAGVARALKPGGIFVAEMGGHGNVAAIVTALIAATRLHGLPDFESPWYYPTPSEYGQLLIEHGFEIESIALIPRPTPLPTGMLGWLKTFAQTSLAEFRQESVATVLDTAVELLKPSLCDSAGDWTADYIRLRFRAKKIAS